VPDAADLLAREARSLAERLRLWTPQRWAAAAPPYGTRGDLAHHLAQSFVAAAGETELPLPRLDSDLVLPDQIAVTADDLALARPDRARDACAHLLLHRSDLLGESVPVGLSRALNLDNVLAAGRFVCAGSPPRIARPY
jgi:hypothetical protein